MITRFHFKGPRRICRFDYLGPPVVFFAFIFILAIVLFRLLS